MSPAPRLATAGLALLAAACAPAPAPQRSPEPTTQPRASPTTVPTPTPAPEGTELVHRKRSEGVEFYALGTEPFWALDFHPERGWLLREPDRADRSWPPEEPGPPSRDGGRAVSVENDGRRLSARLVPEDCRDAMSGAPFTHRVEVELTGEEGATRRLTGCGQFTAAPATGTR